MWPVYCTPCFLFQSDQTSSTLEETCLGVVTPLDLYLCLLWLVVEY